MTIGETIARIILILLAVYGCAQLIRRLCLWFNRCPDCAVCCRLAVPRRGTAMAPLVGCLQGQTVWSEPACRCTLLLLPSHTEETAAELEYILQEAPAVVPVTPEQLTAMLEQLAKE